MNNKRLAEIIKDPGIATEKEVKQIHAYSDEFSYSPFLKVLQARLDHLHNSKDKAKSLTKAAIYIADRSILKDFITKDKLSDETSEDTAVQEKTVKEKKADISDVVTDKKDKSRDKEKVKKVEPVKLKDKMKDEVEEKSTVVQLEEMVSEPVSKQDMAAVKDGEEIQDEETVTNKEKESDAEAETVMDKSSVEDDESPGKGQGELSGKKEEESEEKQVASIEEQQMQGEIRTEEQKKEHEPVAEEQEVEHEPVSDEEPEEQHEPVVDEQVTAKEEPEVESKNKPETSIEDPEEKHKTESSSLSKEIMDNISELKKHKASLLKLLNIGSQDKSSSDGSKPDKSSKKEKSKKKESHKGKKKDLSDKAGKSKVDEPKSSLSAEMPDNENYPDYEEEDPVVIKDFLTRLEESNPPPRKKLKKEEQEKLIEKFINSDPQMQNVRSSKELTDKKDLSAPSVKFRDDIISENLASIMIKQGKHEKAIDIYKKLIWKFPQKKAYFATQIDELKKKLKK